MQSGGDVILGAVIFTGSLYVFWAGRREWAWALGQVTKNLRFLVVFFTLVSLVAGLVVLMLMWGLGS